MPITSSADATRHATRKSASTGQRLQRLTRQHFALYRGYLDGVSTLQLHATYGDAGTELNATRRLIATLRDTLSVAARRARDVEAAYLLRLKPGSIPLDAAQAPADHPTLDEYRERVDPDGVYGESELLELYAADHPPHASPRLDRRAARNARLRRRQADALARMEVSLVHEPRPEHPVNGWFEPAVAARLGAAGIGTLGDLLSLIERRRQRWYVAVPRLGPKGAQRVADWLVLHAESLGHTLSPLAQAPRRQFAAGHPALARIADGATHLEVVPLESLRPPLALDGSVGTNRASPGGRRILADTDVEAIRAWLGTRSGSPHTARAYRREAERALLWAMLAKGKPLSSLDTSDVAEYINDFLAAPRPAKVWIGSARAERFSQAWRPFNGPLSERSRDTARAILRAMGRWLVEQGYWAGNPFDPLPPAPLASSIDVQGRALTGEQWRAVLACTLGNRTDARGQRDFFALLLAFSTGSRRAELAGMTTGDISAGPAGEWRLALPARHGVARAVAMPPQLMDALRDESAFARPVRRSRRVSAVHPAHRAPAHGRRARGGRPRQSLQGDFRAGGAGHRAGRGRLAARAFRRASTHWLRHTHSRHALERGVSLPDLQAVLGHASVSTTALYVKERPVKAVKTRSGDSSR